MADLGVPTVPGLLASSNSSCRLPYARNPARQPSHSCPSPGGRARHGPSGGCVGPDNLPQVAPIRNTPGTRQPCAPGAAHRQAQQQRPAPTGGRASGQVGPGTGAQVEGTHLRQPGCTGQVPPEGAEGKVPRGRREGGPETQRGSQGSGEPAGDAAEAGRACAPAAGAREGEGARLGRPPGTWGPARHLPLGRP